MREKIKPKKGDVRKIKKALKNDDHTVSALARMYGVSRAAIRLIRDGVNWSHIK